MTLQPLYQRLHDLLRRYQLAAGYYTPAGLEQFANWKVSDTEAQIMVQIDAEPKTTAKALCVVLNLEKSTISRSLSSLKRRKFIGINIDYDDRRVRRLTLLKHGRDYLQYHNRLHAVIAERFSAPLSHSELKELERFLKRYADSAGAAPLRRRKGERALIVEMRRLGRAHGIMGDSFLGTGYSTTDWHLLSAINTLPSPVLPSHVSKMLGTPRSTLSPILAHLQKRRLVRIRSLGSDRRSRVLALTPSGQAALQEIEARNIAKMREALADISAEELEWSIDLFARSIGVTPRQVPDGEILLLKGEKLLAAARSFHIERLVECKQTHLASHSLFSPHNWCFSLPEGKTIQAVCELQVLGTSAGVINYSETRSAEQQKSGAALLYQAAKEIFTALPTVEQIEISPESPAYKYAPSLGADLQNGTVEKLAIIRRSLCVPGLASPDSSSNSY